MIGLLKGFFKVNKNLLPLKVELNRHAFLLQIWKRRPAKRLESTIAGSWTGNHPEKIVRISFWTGHFAINQAKELLIIWEICPLCDSLCWISFIVDEHPIFDIFFVGYLWVNFFKNSCIWVCVISISVCIMDRLRF